MKLDSTIIYQNDSLDADFQSFFSHMDTGNIGLFLIIRDIPPAPVLQLTTIYPNPTSDYFYVKNEGVLVEKLEIYDAKIKLLKTIENKIVGTAISVNYKPGVYGVKLYLITGEVKWFKLVIV